MQDDDITVDLNCHKINGRIIIVGDRCVVKNGFICSPEPDAANSTPDDAAIEIVGDKVQVLNCVIQNADTTITPGLAGRIGILASGANNAKIAHCCIKAGNGADSETTAGNGGRGIRFSGCVKCRVIDCEVQSGDGGQGTGVGTPDGGDGGDGICIDSSEGNCIINCVIMSGKGGYATSMSTGGNGGHGILLQDNAADNIIQGCSIKLTGVGGMAEEPGNGGDGIRIANDGVIGTKIFGNTIAHTGAGGTSTIANPDGAGGRAINDLISLVLTVSGATAAFDNFAYDIADTLVRYNIHNTGTESGQDLAMPADNLANVFVP